MVRRYSYVRPHRETYRGDEEGYNGWLFKQTLFFTEAEYTSAIKLRLSDIRKDINVVFKMDDVRRRKYPEAARIEELESYRQQWIEQGESQD